MSQNAATDPTWRARWFLYQGRGRQLPVQAEASPPVPRWRVLPCRVLSLPFADEFGAQHQTFDRIMPAIDLFRIVGEADRLDDSALLDDRAGTLDLQILDQGDGITIRQHIARRIAHFLRTRSLRSQFGSGPPFACGFVIHIIVIVSGHCRLS
ncbi:hypothetical protein AGR9A_Cc120243 [Agrobacterium salinitolerans str. Hayward 0363]|nr:hypothetical protein AGR9A_Cc120243 [Agrobacterium salinitolerans str. Hayward 0363]